MELTPQAIRVAGFTTVKRGYDPDEVEAFKARVAEELESLQSQASAMEARARAAVAKLQELTQQGAGQRSEVVVSAPGESSPSPAAPASSDVPDMISRTLLLAQRTADATIADARDEAAAIVGEGRQEAARMLESARAMAARTVDDARHEARRSAEDERVRIENEVQAMLARRDFLVADVDQLELYIQAERDRLREAANHLLDLVDRVPGGLGETRRPLLSAADAAESFWSEPSAVVRPIVGGGDPTEAIVAPSGAAAPIAAIAGAEQEVVDATVEVLHRLLPDVEAPAAPAAPATFDDWDDSGPTPVPATSAASPLLDDEWTDDVPLSGTSRSPQSFEDDSFWSMPRADVGRSFDDLSDEIPRPVVDGDATMPMAEPTPVHGDLRIGGDDLD